MALLKWINLVMELVEAELEWLLLLIFMNVL
jgi:hypothetical protein